MQQQQQLQWSAACQWVLGWMGGGGGGGEGGEGVCGRGSGGVRQLMVRAPAGHTGASRWRTSEPPHSSTKPCQPWLPAPTSNPNRSVLLLRFDSLSLSLFSLLPPWLFFPSSVSSFCWFASRFIYYSTPFFFSLTAVLSVAVPPDSVFSTFSPESCGFLHLRHPFSALSLLNPFTLNVPRKYLVAWLKKSKQGWFGLCVSQNTVKIVSIFKRKEHFNGALDICNGIRL